MPAFEVPVVPRRFWGPACLGLSILPGVGTLVAAGNQESRKHLWIGLTQLLLFWLIVPWIWSIVWGVLIFRASEKELEVRSVPAGTHDAPDAGAEGSGAGGPPARPARKPAKRGPAKAAKKPAKRA